jgi:hypothetical protein
MSDASSHEPGGVCRSCPVCIVLQALQEVHPDVRAHLAAAGRELVLALRAAATSYGESGTSSDVAQDNERERPSGAASDGDPRRLRRIDIQ